MSVNVAVTAAQHTRDWFDYWTLGSAVAGVFVLAFYTYYAKKQRDAVNEANELARRALEDARRSSITAVNQAQTANGIALRAYQETTLHNNETIGAMRLANEAAERRSQEALAETRQSNAATERSNELAEKALIYGRRSWLIPSVDSTSPVSTPDGWKVVFYVSNSGPVPGVLKNAHARVSTKDGTVSLPTMFATPGAVIPPGASGPETGLRLVANVPPGITDEMMAADDGAPIRASCTIAYGDIFSGEWETALGWVHGKDRLWYNDTAFEVVFK